MDRGPEGQLDHLLGEDPAVLDVGAPAVELHVPAQVGGVGVEVHVLEAVFGELGRRVRQVDVGVDDLEVREERLQGARLVGGRLDDRLRDLPELVGREAEPSKGLLGPLVEVQTRRSTPGTENVPAADGLGAQSGPDGPLSTEVTRPGTRWTERTSVDA